MYIRINTLYAIILISAIILEQLFKYHWLSIDNKLCYYYVQIYLYRIHRSYLISFHFLKLNISNNITHGFRCGIVYFYTRSKKKSCFNARKTSIIWYDNVKFVLRANKCVVWWYFIFPLWWRKKTEKKEDTVQLYQDNNCLLR